MTERIELRLPAEAPAVPRIRRAVEAFAVAHGVEDAPAVALAVTEAATNAVIHAYRDGTSGDVRVVACAEPRELVVVVRDYGCGMQPNLDSPGLGIGVSTIAQLTDGFDIETPDGEGTRLRMRFPRQPAVEPVLRLRGTEAGRRRR